jgi:hypothetical protein
MVTRLIGGLIGLALMAGCSGPPADIASSCSATGGGDVDCEFHNKGKGEGTACVKLVLKENKGSGVLESRPICSGIVKPDDVVQRRTSGGFNMGGEPLDPMTFCRYDSYSSYGSWSDNCTMDVVPAESEGEETSSSAG